MHVKDDTRAVCASEAASVGPALHRAQQVCFQVLCAAGSGLQI